MTSTTPPPARSPADDSPRAACPGDPIPEVDLVDSSLIRPLVRLLDGFDRDILALYDDLAGGAGVPGFRSRFAGPLIQLGRRGPQTVRQLADGREVTHSAMSQTVAAMRRDGFVEDAARGGDARTRRVQLSERASELLPFLEAEWRATETTLRELDAEIPYPLTRVVADLRAALARHPFADRLQANLRHLLDPGS